MFRGPCNSYTPPPREVFIVRIWGTLPAEPGSREVCKCSVVCATLTRSPRAERSLQHLASRSFPAKSGSLAGKLSILPRSVQETARGKSCGAPGAEEIRPRSRQYFCDAGRNARRPNISRRGRADSRASLPRLGCKTFCPLRGRTSAIKLHGDDRSCRRTALVGQP